MKKQLFVINCVPVIATSLQEALAIRAERVASKTS